MQRSEDYVLSRGDRRAAGRVKDAVVEDETLQAAKSDSEHDWQRGWPAATLPGVRRHALRRDRPLPRLRTADTLPPLGAATAVRHLRDADRAGVPKADAGAVRPCLRACRGAQQARV